MIERLVKILRNAGLEDVTAVEIAEMILLADAFPVAEAATTGGAGAGEPDEPTPPGSAAQPPQTDDPGLLPESAKPQPPQATLIDQATQDAAEGEGVDLAPFRAPRANPLPGERKIARALRPLRRRHPSTRRFILDEEKTIRRIADGGPISLVLQPAPEAWLEVALVFDESVTMRVWRQTLERLQHFFESCGYFRDVRAWRLNTESDEAKLYRATAAAGASRPLHRPGELLDPTGRRLIVVVSDCHAPAWHTGAAYAVIHDWALKGPVALVQALPEPFWAGTTMTPVDAALRVPKSAATNRLLQIAQAPYRHVIEAGGVALPIVTLDEWSIAPWARAVAGATGVSISGLVIPPPEAMALALAAQPKAEAGGSAELLTAVERVENFFNSSASKEAKQLARYLASAPLSLPVMQLVQQAMLPQARQSHLAEVFLSGLLYQSTSYRNPDEIIYEFYEGVRDELRRFVTEAEILRVIYEVSRYIESRIGETGDFEAALAVPAAGGAVKRLDPLSRRFAVLSADILRRFGRYQESVLKLERLAGLASAAKQEMKDAASVSNRRTRIVPGPDPNDPWKGVFGGLHESNYRLLSASVEPRQDSYGWFTLKLTVRSTDPENHPLRGNVKYYLHPLFWTEKPILVDQSQNDEYMIYQTLSWGAFTVGVEADNGLTQLELDLAKQLDLPVEFRRPLRELVDLMPTLTHWTEGVRGPVQLTHLIKEISKILQEVFPQNIELQVIVPEGLWTVIGDTTQIHQVLMNLCINARDAMPDGGRLLIKVRNRYLVEEEERLVTNPHQKQYVRITVADTGIGFAPEIVDRVFDPFFTTKEKWQGSGMGLSTVQEIVRGHRGFVNVLSQIGEGTEFKIYLPVIESIQVFFSYSPKDEALRDELSKHLSILKRQGVIDEWHDRQIPDGAEWEAAIDDRINQAQVILLLVSSDFLASDYCHEIEMKRALERHDRGEAVIIPIILRSCEWQGASFGKLQALPKDAKPVTNWANKDEAFMNVVEGIRRAVEGIRARSGSLPTP